MANDLTTDQPRLPVPEGVDPDEWRVLTEAIFPNAQTVRAIRLAMSYCKVRGLDIMKRPVNIVSIWNSALGKSVESVWPGIGEVEITAARTGWAGMDEPRFGPMITETFKGQRKDRQKGWVNAEATVTFPEWCAVTVYRIVGGVRCAFTEPVWWKEAYGRVGRDPLPNDMWAKRPRGQLIKVAKAFSLRAAFPEEGEPTSDEMEGQVIETPPGPAVPADNWKPPEENTFGPQAQKVADAAPDQDPPDQGDGQDQAPPHDPETGEVIEPHELEREKDEPWRAWCIRLLGYIRLEKDLDTVEQWVGKNKKQIEALVKEVPKMHTQLSAAIGKQRLEIMNKQKEQEAREREKERQQDQEQEAPL